MSVLFPDEDRCDSCHSSLSAVRVKVTKERYDGIFKDCITLEPEVETLDVCYHCLESAEDEADEQERLTIERIEEV